VKGQIPVQVVAADKHSADEVLSRIGTAGISILGEAVDGGFSEYVVSREAG
jgi:hypothetical protein